MYKGEALPLEALALIMISLLPTNFEKVSDANNGIKKVFFGSGL